MVRGDVPKEVTFGHRAEGWEGTSHSMSWGEGTASAKAQRRVKIKEI